MAMCIDKSWRHDAASAVDPPHRIGNIETADSSDSSCAQKNIGTEPLLAAAIDNDATGQQPIIHLKSLPWLCPSPDRYCSGDRSLHGPPGATGRLRQDRW